MIHSGNDIPAPRAVTSDLVAEDAEHPGVVFYNWLIRELRKRADLAEQDGYVGPVNIKTLVPVAGIENSTFTRWGRGEIRPSVEMVRKVAHALGIPAPRLMVIAKILLPDEVSVQTVVPDIKMLTDQEIWDEHDERFNPRRRRRQGTASLDQTIDGTPNLHRA